MKKIINKIFIIFVLLSNAYTLSVDLVESTKKKVPETKIFKSIVEDKEEQLAQLKKEKDTLDAEKEAIFKAIKVELSEIKNKRAETEKLLTQEQDDEFLIKTLSLLTATHDVLNDMHRIWEGLIKKISDHMVIIEKFLKDSEFKEYRKDLKIAAGPYFFEDLEVIHQKIASEQQFIEQLRKRKESATKEQKNLQQMAEKLADEYKERKGKIDEFGKTPIEAQALTMPLGMNVKQRAELLSIEANLFKLKKDLNDLQLREKKAEVAAIDTEFFLESFHLEILQDAQRKIKSAITVTHEQLDVANRELEKKRQLFSSLKARYNDEINKIRKIREDESARLTHLSQKYGISLGNELGSWSLEPQKTRESYMGLCEVGELNTYVLLLDAREAYLEALIALEQEKINYVETISNIKESYYKIATRKFAADDDISNEIRSYSEKRNVTETALKSAKAKKDEVEALLLKLQNEVWGRIKKVRAVIQQQREAIFRGALNDYATCLVQLDKSEEYIVQQMDSVAGAGKAYSEIISMLDKLNGHLRFIVSELESITIWYRPECAVSWFGLSHVLTDIKYFFADVRSYFLQFDIKSVIPHKKTLAKKSWVKFFLMLKILGLFFCCLLLRRFVFVVTSPMRRFAQRVPPLLQPFVLFAVFILEFLGKHSIGLTIWLSALLLLKSYFLPDPYLYILWYLISIPYLLFLTHRFIQSLRQFNESHKFCFIGADSANRVLILLSILLNTTIVLMLFREAFMLSKVPKSELPKILLTLNIIVFQICFIFLLTKDVVLWLIPTRFEFGQIVYRWADRYYYLLMGLIIIAFVLWNPYVGYARLVEYLVTGLVYSILLLYALYWFHGLIKKGASQLFFRTQDDIVKERFAYAKTFFGASLIASFTLLAVVGFLAAAKIWGWPVFVQDVVKWFNHPLFGIGKGTATPLTLTTVGTIALFVLTGFVIAFGFNRFVLDKIFDLMLVDSGVQHAITNMVRYLIVIAAILLGLQSVGYGGIITYFYVLILGIGYLIQNPLNDLFAYFILLIQRPINIGDYIKIDDEIIGVVRKITPKSVVIRKKNSTTVVIPNSMITTKPIFNWNYSSNFIAFDDIKITVSYKEDPEKVKALLLRAVESHGKVLKTPRPIIRLSNFTELGYEFMVRGFLSPNYTLEQLDIASDVRLAIIKILRQEGMDIAVPMRVVANLPSNSKS